LGLLLERKGVLSAISPIIDFAGQCLLEIILFSRKQSPMRANRSSFRSLAQLEGLGLVLLLSLCGTFPNFSKTEGSGLVHIPKFRNGSGKILANASTPDFSAASDIILGYALRAFPKIFEIARKLPASCSWVRGLVFNRSGSSALFP
jgi:hypothetical protein